MHGPDHCERKHSGSGEEKGRGRELGSNPAVRRRHVLMGILSHISLDPHVFLGPASSHSLGHEDDQEAVEFPKRSPYDTGVFREGCHSTGRLLLRGMPALEPITGSVSLFASFQVLYALNCQEILSSTTSAPFLFIAVL